MIVSVGVRNYQHYSLRSSVEASADGPFAIKNSTVCHPLAYFGWKLFYFKIAYFANHAEKVRQANWATRLLTRDGLFVWPPFLKKPLLIARGNSRRRALIGQNGGSCILRAEIEHPIRQTSFFQIFFLEISNHFNQATYFTQIFLHILKTKRFNTFHSLEKMLLTSRLAARVPKTLIIGGGGQLGPGLARVLRSSYGTENVILSDVRKANNPEAKNGKAWTWWSRTLVIIY